MNLDDVRHDLRALADREVVLYGSAARGEATPRSDIDVAVLTRERDRGANQDAWLTLVGRAPDRYDIRVFELLPIHIQADIVRDHRIVFGDPVEISAYLYPVRRMWRDVRHRYERPLPPRERLALLRRGG